MNTVKTTKYIIIFNLQYYTSKQAIYNGSRNNDKGEYKADGPLNNKVKSKINYDHHKGVYGSLAMLKTVADIICFASIEYFKAFKVYFLHAGAYYFEKECRYTFGVSASQKEGYYEYGEKQS
ncbi:uncharacterized protein BX663DRAFT_485586 [Cokeromyces recurvatus]|uniref:uncharacterized protein n=1 Tax=Cokeromyces recurvatus TaxID=90255 RepID=UPI00221E89D9|nr:uncharacterized protein BX663DRAFT_485586 [Cokeromyces recurvatus]KAI7903431.1 hypothetical protein BX663DRAFT_485586 [Cokeromyces recurvatus]